MFTIDKNSEAGQCLAGIFADPDTYKVSVDYRPSRDGGEFVAVKKNEGMWTHSLSTVSPGHPAHFYSDSYSHDDTLRKRVGWDRQPPEDY